VGTAYTQSLAELRRTDAGEYGGKSANLGELLAAGIPVPPGFALAAHAFHAFVEEAGLEGTIAAALFRASAGEVEEVGAVSKAIGEAMRFAPLPEAVREQLEQRHDELARALGEEEPPVAVRSSALGEDSEDATHAGQQESFLWVRGLEQVCDAVRDCWVSLFTPGAITYRAELKAATSDPAMGVTVQQMVDAEVSGVMFTCNPVSGDPSMVAINASWGLGIAVVSGETTPDDYLLSKVTGEVVRSKVNAKEIEYIPDVAGRGTVRVEVSPERREEPCLGGAQLAALLEVARRIEGHFGTRQDIEWAIARGRPLPDALVVLQTRPVTALPDPPTKVSASAMSLVLGTFGAAPRPPKQS
jgi:pyruvate,water dikinase